jgi:hypothetical protein
LRFIVEFELVILHKLKRLSSAASKQKRRPAEAARKLLQSIHFVSSRPPASRFPVGCGNQNFPLLILKFPATQPGALPVLPCLPTGSRTRRRLAGNQPAAVRRARPSNLGNFRGNLED